MQKPHNQVVGPVLGDKYNEDLVKTLVQWL